MKCQFCGVDVVEWNKPIRTHLIATNSSDHVHVHGPLESKEVMKQLLERSAETLGISFKEPHNILEKKEIVFHNKQRIGDILMFTAGIRDFKTVFPHIRVNVSSTASHIWDNNPYIDPTLKATNENTIKIGPSKLTNMSNCIDWHFANAYRVSIENALNIHIPQGESCADIWLTEEEYNSPRLTKDPYWIIIIGGERGWGTKMYPFERWQTFIKQNPDVLFYQLGAREDNQLKLQGNNIVDYIGKTQDHNTGIRDLFKLFLNAEGSIGLVSFHMHLSAVFHKPCIVIAGAREPVSFTQYPGHRYLATDGTLPCAVKACWHCNIDACEDLVVVNNEKIPKCVDLIQPEDLTKALRLYYDGGRLKKTVASEKPKFKNIAKVAFQAGATEVEKQKSNETKFGIPFGNTCIEREDWEFMEKVISKYNIKSVIEFGSGLSTLLMLDKGLRVVSFETDQAWIDKLKKINPNCDTRFWNGKSADIPNERFDMALIDGPAGGEKREEATRMASELADYIIVHDANRKYERFWQEKYLLNKFQGIVRGGRRIHFWGKKLRDETIMPFICAETTPEITVLAKLVNSQKKYIKFVFNGRGEGGAETSVVWMMNTLLSLGHRVTYHTPNPQPCGTFRKIGNKSIRVENIDTLNEACDILVLYSNDWIWNFGKQEILDIFSNINADKKILCVNYKLDKIGLLSWTKDWDLYLFLNSTFEKALLDRLPNAKTKVLAPPVDLTKYFTITPDYSSGLRLIRHSSQGDCKYPKDFNEIVEKVLDTRDDINIRLMPAPSFLQNFDSRVLIHQKNIPSIDEFLKLGNCFWYLLPHHFSEGGPKTVMEAQASGLAVIADNHSGMRDRVVDRTGWLANSVEEHLSIIKNISSKELEEYGKNAREHARVSYDPMSWIKNILQEI